MEVKVKLLRPTNTIFAFEFFSSTQASDKNFSLKFLFKGSDFEQPCPKFVSPFLVFLVILVPEKVHTVAKSSQQFERKSIWGIFSLIWRRVFWNWSAFENRWKVPSANLVVNFCGFFAEARFESQKVRLNGTSSGLPSPSQARAYECRAWTGPSVTKTSYRACFGLLAHLGFTIILSYFC